MATQLKTTKFVLWVYRKRLYNTRREWTEIRKSFSSRATARAAASQINHAQYKRKIVKVTTTTQTMDIYDVDKSAVQAAKVKHEKLLQSGLKKLRARK